MAKHVCPYWAGVLLASPLRRLMHNPKKILGPYLDKGMTVLDVGCALGFFSLEAARIVGPAGKVVCVDVQARMIRGLSRRAARAGLFDRIDARTCREDDLGISDLAGVVDLVLAFAVVHEVPDPVEFFSQVRQSLAPKGYLLLAEPKGHVSQSDFEQTVQVAEAAAMEVVDHPKLPRSHGCVLRKL